MKRLLVIFYEIVILGLSTRKIVASLLIQHVVTRIQQTVGLHPIFHQCPNYCVVCTTVVRLHFFDSNSKSKYRFLGNCCPSNMPNRIPTSRCDRLYLVYHFFLVRESYLRTNITDGSRVYESNLTYFWVGIIAREINQLIKNSKKMANSSWFGPCM